LCLRYRMQVGLSALVTVFFLTLPAHLRFGIMIFADSWLVPLWALALWVYRPEKPRSWWLFILVVVLSSLFMWFAVFLLPIPWVLHFAQRSRGQVALRGLGLFLGLALLVLAVQGGIVALWQDYFLVSSLQKWTIFKPKGQLNLSVPLLARQTAALLQEALPILLVLVVWFIGRRKFPTLFSTTAPRGLGHLAVLMGLALVLMVIAVPLWFQVHAKVVSFFALFFALALAWLLQQWDSASKTAWLLSVLAIFFNLSIISWDALQQLASPIRDDIALEYYINQQRVEDQKLAVFMDIPAQPEYAWVNLYALIEQTDSYIFDSTLIGHPPQESSFSAGLRRLTELGVESLHTDRIIYLSPGAIPAGIPVLRHQTFRNLHVYVVARP
ncbi:MAG: hypothetical protein AAFQ98_20565, partial [Bacteroidota bacterium]